jgi:hypothetical protein
VFKTRGRAVNKNEARTDRKEDGMGKNRLNGKLLTAAFGGAAALSAYAFLIRPWHLRWGATDEEVKMPFPGDELVEHPKLNATHAITI